MSNKFDYNAGQGETDPNDQQDEFDQDENNQEENAEQNEGPIEQLEKLIQTATDSSKNVLARLKAIKQAKELIDGELANFKQQYGDSIGEILKNLLLEQHYLTLMSKLYVNIKVKRIAFLCFHPLDLVNFHKAKKYKSREMQQWIKKIKLELKVNKVKFFKQLIQMLLPVLPYILIGLGVLILVLIVAAFIDSIFGGAIGGNGGMNSQFGANGNSFQAVRLVYEDDAKANQQILNDYATIVYNSIDSISDGEDYTVQLNLTLPEDKTADFNPTTADEKLVDLMGKLTETAYVYYNPDYASQDVDLATITLDEKLKGITYFGLNADLISSFKTEIVSNFLLFNFNQEGGVLTFTNLGEDDLDPATVKANIQTALDNYFATISTARSQKYFIQDQVLEGDAMLENVEKRNYLALMYLPRQNVSIKNLMIYGNGVDTSNFSITFNGKTFTDYSVWEIQDDLNLYCYTLLENANFVTPAVSNFDASTAYTTPISIDKIANNANANSYVTLNDEGVYSYIDVGLVINFNSELPFSFVDELSVN